MRNSNPKPRVAIVAHRFQCLGGIQTCFMELIAGLNEIGIVPEIVWDEPTDWDALGNPELQADFRQGKLGISSSKLRSLPGWLADRLRAFSLRTARLNLERFDFVYSFEPGIRIPRHVPNLCYICGPPFLRMPDEKPSFSRNCYSEFCNLLRYLTTQTLKPDPCSHYVTLSGWIAQMWLEKFGVEIEVIWPPARSRPVSKSFHDRSGFLFLSRIQEYKRPESLLSLAKAFPDQEVTIAGVVHSSCRDLVRRLQDRIVSENLLNVDIIEDPTEGEVAELFARHAVFVYPAHWEHFGIVTVEAIRAGLLPLVHDSGGQREIVPKEALRFHDENELVVQAGQILQMQPMERQQLLSILTQHVSRSSPARYRESMLRFLPLDT